MKPLAYSIWLMPCAEQRTELEQIIRELSVRCRAPLFIPHTTLCSGIWSKSEEDLRDAFERLAAQTAPVELDVRGIDWTDHWNSFFFLRLRGAEDLFQRAASCIERSHLSEVGSHLSLLYRFNPEGLDREALRQELVGRLPPCIRFDSVALVRPLTGLWEDVDQWKILLSADLTG